MCERKRERERETEREMIEKCWEREKGKERERVRERGRSAEWTEMNPLGRVLSRSQHALAEVAVGVPCMFGGGIFHDLTTRIAIF